MAVGKSADRVISPDRVGGRGGRVLDEIEKGANGCVRLCTLAVGWCG